MHAKNDLQVDVLRERFSYDPVSGIFTRIKWTNARSKVGSAVHTQHPRGYVCVCIGRRKYLAHRLAWLYVHGRWPDGEIDHINGDKKDNRISNLRVGTSAQNKQNIRGASTGNKSSGLLGAAWARGAWQSQIKLNGKAIYIGRFPTAELAHFAYLDAKKKFHQFSTL